LHVQKEDLVQAEKERTDLGVNLLAANVKNVPSALQERFVSPPVPRVILDLRDLSTLISRFQVLEDIQEDSDKCIDVQ
jgi:hypothetical protein